MALVNTRLAKKVEKWVAERGTSPEILVQLLNQMVKIAVVMT